MCNAVGLTLPQRQTSSLNLRDIFHTSLPNTFVVRYDTLGSTTASFFNHGKSYDLWVHGVGLMTMELCRQSIEYKQGYREICNATYCGHSLTTSCCNDGSTSELLHRIHPSTSAVSWQRWGGNRPLRRQRLEEQQPPICTPMHTPMQYPSVLIRRKWF